MSQTANALMGYPVTNMGNSDACLWMPDMHYCFTSVAGPLVR